MSVLDIAPISTCEAATALLIAALVLAAAVLAFGLLASCWRRG